MDDLERAILYSFDETGAVAPDLKVPVDTVDTLSGSRVLHHEVSMEVASVLAAKPTAQWP